MTKIETKKGLSPNAAEKMFNFLSDMNNFEQLMPEDRIEKWASTEEQCEFNIKGMAHIGLKRIASTPFNQITIESFGKVPFPFTLELILDEKTEKSTEISILFQGEINAFMKMIVEKPLTNFFNMLVDKATALTL